MLPFETESIAAIHCYQFIEHFTYEEIVHMLLDWQRVLRPGGVAYIATPHALSSMSWQALDHKTHWNEEVWDWLFGNEYYNPANTTIEWKLRVHACFIMGVVWRNLNVFTQLVKVA
jgi:predicted SAM-dependent methyltransferase